jgi:glycosyltransferase involved in cell wall biosynthesis
MFQATLSSSGKSQHLQMPPSVDTTLEVKAPDSAKRREATLSVLHVVGSLDCGGLERVVIDLTRERQRLHRTVSILCIEKPGVLAAHAEADGLHLLYADKGPGLSWSAVNRIRSLLESLRPDVVHTHQISALLYIAPINRRLAPVLVHTEHSNQFRLYQTLREKFRYRSMLTIAGRRADRIFGVSEDATQAIKRSHIIARSRLFTVPNGIDLSRFLGINRSDSLRQKLGIPPGDLVIGNVGRLNEIKRPDILIEVFAKIRSEFSNTHLLLVGDGPLMPGLRKRASDLGIAEGVHFTGFQQDPEPYLRVMDVFVLTSRMEGTPLAILEAGASGIPVIASRVGGLEEMSNRGRSMLLYDFNDLSALHSGLRRLISDSEFRHQLGEAGRKHVLAAYSSRRMVLDYESHYNDLIRRR